MSKQGCGKCRHWVCVAPMRYKNGYYGTCTLSKKETREDYGTKCNAFELVNKEVKIKRLTEDTRPILRIGKECGDGCWRNSYDVGRDGITKIEPYEEAGWGDFVPWFAIWKDDFLWRRTPAQGWDVEYAVISEEVKSD